MTVWILAGSADDTALALITSVTDLRNFEQTVEEQFSIHWCISELARSDRWQLIGWHRCDKFGSDQNDEFGFGFLIRLATECRSDIRQFAEERKLLSGTVFALSHQTGDDKRLTEIHLHLSVRAVRFESGCRCTRDSD